VTRRAHPRWYTLLRLAAADLRAEWMLALCTVVALAAVLAPLVVLAGLRAGVIEGLRRELLENPHAREVVSAANRRFSSALLASIGRRPDVSFLVPKTRTLSSTLLLEQTDARGAGTRVELIPTAPGDPLVAAGRPAGGDTAIVLSAAAAARLHALPGQELVGRVGRIIQGERQTAAIPLRVSAVAQPAAFEREGAFVGLPLAVFVEDYQDGVLGLPADPSAFRSDIADREFAGFRLYARRLEDVPAIDTALRAQGIDVVSRAADVAGLLRTDRNLTLLFRLVAGLGGTGFLVSLGAGLWASVDRKRVSLALLRFLGLSAVAICLVPIVQAFIMAAIGVGIALFGAKVAALVVNRAFAGTLALERPLCLVSARLAIAAGLITVLGAVLVSCAAGIRAARVEPWEGVTPT